MNCRLCNSNFVTSIIPLGDQPLANGLIKEENLNNNELFVNLEVMLCDDCGLVQLKDLVPPSKLFSDYPYYSSNSSTMLESAAQLCSRIMSNLAPEAFIVEIASNDGYLLKNYTESNYLVLGIEPAKNIADYAMKIGINTVSEFFDDRLADEVIEKYSQADIIHANNVMAHVPDIHSLVSGFSKLLAPQGSLIIEVPYLLDLVKNLEFDTIYHEHVFYFSVKPLVNIFKKYNLEIFDIEKLSIHGGSLRLFVGHVNQHPCTDVVEQYISLEEENKIHEKETYIDFMKGLDTLKVKLNLKLKDLIEKGNRLVGYGASAKGSTLLNFFGISKYLDYIVDRSKFKQGLYTPGTHLAIKDPEHLLQDFHEYTLLLTWNFAQEIMSQQAEYRSRGGKFIVPLPNPEIF